jgi:hypothetical protein
MTRNSVVSLTLYVNKTPEKGKSLLESALAFGRRSADRQSAGLTVWLSQPYVYGVIICMKKTFHVDDDLLKEAKAACGASTDTETIRLGLEALMRRAAYERLRALLGSEPNAQDVPRRREKPQTRRRVA